jgi:hypothetical protein
MVMAAIRVSGKVSSRPAFRGDPNEAAASFGTRTAFTRAACLALGLVTAQAAAAATVTYTSIETIPVPPASN